jgi:hypothetical protein
LKNIYSSKYRFDCKYRSFSHRLGRFLFSLLASLATLSLLSAPTIADDNPEIVSISVMGRAEILSSGVWYEAKTGEIVKPGEWVRVVGDGEMSLSGNDGKSTVTLKDQTSVRYDGVVDPNSRPWRNGAPVTSAYAPVQPGGEATPQYTIQNGEVEVEVTPGQPLRVITPLIASAVRGTNFVVTVSKDGSSRLKTIEGTVFVLSRTGQSQEVKTGSSMKLTSSQYVQFLRQNGVNVPDGDWLSVEPDALEQLDAKYLDGSNSEPTTYATASATKPEDSPPTARPETQFKKRSENE